jgi:putative spermidine/putrescine transport system permease protein
MFDRTSILRVIGRTMPRAGIGLLIVCFFTPYLLLFWLSLGSGWSYPNLTPDRIDFRPWRAFLRNEGLWLGALTSVILSPCVATCGTLLGLLIGRQVNRSRGIWIYMAYLPFACSPVIIGICLLDLFIRLNLASTLLGVFLIQSVFAAAYAVIFFSELWNPEIERYEQVVQTLGGDRWDTFRHAIWPRLGRLVLVCWIQTLLFSWLDYGLVSVIGGGIVPSLTLSVIAYIREASINQAAQAAIVLIIPPIPLMLVVGSMLGRRIAPEANRA